MIDTAGFKHPKPVKADKPRKAMNKIGPVGKRRLAANKERREQDLPWQNICEVAPILRWRGITFSRCVGELTWAHAKKKRSKKAEVGTPEHEGTVCRACEHHHYKFLDQLLKADVACSVVMEAIERRQEL